MNSIPAGKWVVDASHSAVTFTVKHLMISKVRGTFGGFSGMAVTDGKNILNTSVEGSIDVSTIDTKDDNRDAHLRSADFFDVENFPAMKLVSQKITHVKDDKYQLEALLTIKNVTEPVKIDVEFGGINTDPYGNIKGAAEAEFTIDRTKFGLTWNAALETGGVLVSNDVKVSLDIQAVLEK